MRQSIYIPCARTWVVDGREKQNDFITIIVGTVGGWGGVGGGGGGRRDRRGALLLSHTACWVAAGGRGCLRNGGTAPPLTPTAPPSYQWGGQHVLLQTRGGGLTVSVARFHLEADSRSNFAILSVSCGLMPLGMRGRRANEEDSGGHV